VRGSFDSFLVQRRTCPPARSRLRGAARLKYLRGHNRKPYVRGPKRLPTPGRSGQGRSRRARSLPAPRASVIQDFKCPGWPPMAPLSDMTYDNMPGAELRVWDMDLASFADRAASREPSPGSGAVSLVSAAIGIALVLKALRVTASGSNDREAFEPLIRSGENLREELSAHAEADLDVFEAHMAAQRLPNKTDAEKSEREERLAKAYEAAVEVPLNAAQTTLEGLDLARQAVHLCDPATVGNIGAGAALLNGALTAALYNVDCAVPNIQDTVLRNDYRTSRDHLQKVADARHDTIRRVLTSRLSPDAEHR